MKKFGEVLAGIGFFGMLLFGSGADLNEVHVTIIGLFACSAIMAAGTALEKAGRQRRRRRTARYRGTVAAAGVTAAVGIMAVIINIASATPAQAAAGMPETEPIMIEIHSERDVIEINEAPPIAIYQEIETAAAPTAPTEAEEPEEDGAAGFIYLPEVQLTYDQQKKLYTMWTGAGYDYIKALALADQETGGTFETTAINHNTHDYGLFQLNRQSWQGTFKRMYGIGSMDDMLDFELNIKGALYVYGDCVDRYGETERALVAYNMGSAKYDSTEYSRSVMAKYRKWEAAYQAAEK